MEGGERLSQAGNILGGPVSGIYTLASINGARAASVKRQTGELVAKTSSASTTPRWPLPSRETPLNLAIPPKTQQGRPIWAALAGLSNPIAQAEGYQRRTSIQQLLARWMQSDATASRRSEGLRNIFPRQAHSSNNRGCYQYYGLGQNQEGFLDDRAHTVNCWTRLQCARRRKRLCPLQCRSFQLAIESLGCSPQHGSASIPSPPRSLCPPPLFVGGRDENHTLQSA